ncbi:hypothetical protein CDEST_03831 [Colletotrichum destructivum]|uniref:Uncharacterized protein n=1 Tax=Colletotrichum destructivum TaxID=34406 RepID=A0AAX4I609_9PEZI|nr:hypothetical protein CDEST_03831 [Colletotrichum destructivum]
MDEADNRPIREGPLPPPVLEDPPPPYVKEEELPSYPSANYREPAPGSPVPVPVPAPAPVLVPAVPTRFPPVFNGYAIDSWNFHLGASLSQKRFRLSVVSIFLHTASVCLHDGLDADDEVLARLVREDCSRQHYHHAIRLPAVEGLRAEEERILMHYHEEPRMMNRELYEIVVDVGGVEERFQWRPSRGKEVKSVGKHAIGWKLVRMAAQQAGAGGWRKNRSEGFSSRGEEVVAVLALTFCETKKFTFLFLGSGRSGALGEAWQTAALLSGVWRWSISGY